MLLADNMGARPLLHQNHQQNRHFRNPESRIYCKAVMTCKLKSKLHGPERHLKTHNHKFPHCVTEVYTLLKFVSFHLSKWTLRGGWE